MRCLRALLSFFTRIPAGYYSLEEVYSCTHLLPLLGAVEALIVSTPLLALAPHPWIAAVLATILHAAVTGGLHIDGLADYMDAVLAGARGEDARRLMKDPRLGTGGVLAVTLHTILSVVALASLARLQPLQTLYALLAAYALAAYSMLLAPLLGGEEPYRGLASVYHRYAARNAVRAAPLAILALTPLLAYNTIPAAASIAAWLATTYLAARDAAERLGYISGDVIGMIYEASRLAMLTTLALLTRY